MGTISEELLCDKTCEKDQQCHIYKTSKGNSPIFNVSTVSGTRCQTLRCHYRQTINRPQLPTVPVADGYRQLSSQKDTLFLEMALCCLLWQFVGGTLVSACPHNMDHLEGNKNSSTFTAVSVYFRNPQGCRLWDAEFAFSTTM